MRGITEKRNYWLIRELVITDFKLRYQGSVLGYLWSLLKPMMLFTVLYVVFTKILRFGDAIPHYPAYLLLGIVIWTFFTEATSMGLHAIVDRGDLIRKVSIPKYTIVISTVLSAFVNFCLNMVVVTAFIIFTKADISWGVVFFPLIVLELVLFSLPVAFLLAALFVRYRDISHIWELLLQVMFYGTPIIYPLNIVPPRIAAIISLNPMTQIIQSARRVMVTPHTLLPSDIYSQHFLGFVLPIVIIIVLNILAVLYFRKSSRTFAEDL